MWLSENDVKLIHFALVEDFARSDNPISPSGVRSQPLLASAVFRPETAIGETLKYPTVETSAAALLHALVLNHPFYNGNKRTALVSMLVFLDRNGFVPTCSEDDLFKLVLQVAQHRISPLAPDAMADREVLAIAEWMWKRIRLVEKGEIPVSWRRFRKILTAYGCETTFPTGAGNRLNITRTLEQKIGIFSRRNVPPLSTQVFHRDGRSDVRVDTIKKIREDLRLDDAHGVDSHDFYDREPARISDFITTYRKTLDRLAKL